MKKIILILILIIIIPLSLISKDFDFSRIYGIDVNMPKEKVFKMLDKQKIAYKKGKECKEKYNKEYFVIDSTRQILQARFDQLEFSFSDTISKGFVSFDVYSLNIDEFKKALKEECNCSEEIPRLGITFIKHYYDNCTVMYLEYHDTTKNPFVFIVSDTKKCDKP